MNAALKSLFALATWAGLAALADGAQARDAGHPEWPCVQRKVDNLSVGQVWDGPSIDGLEGWWQDSKVNALINLLATRRLPQETIDKALKEFADAEPADKRDERLTYVFAGFFDKMNGERRTVMRGIERYQKALEERAQDIERQGVEIAELEKKAAEDEKAAAELEGAQQKYEWASRIFHEKQSNMPIACEVPVIIDQHVYTIGKAVRALMKS